MSIRFTISLIALAAYLLVGCLIMLVADSCFHGSVTRKEFVKGMLVWPLLAWHMLEFFCAALLSRLRG